MLVGMATRDDAGVYKISENLALVQTVDFFTPIVDDPYDFGEIAVANALSDIYAMGGMPITGLNIVGYPPEIIDKTVIAEILKGGYNKARDADVHILGGHSVKDPELKYGMAISGIIHPEEIVPNSSAQVGDVLVLTKPIGTGILTTALKNDKLPDDLLGIVSSVMKQLNRGASELMRQYGVHACTDITGYGLLGHLFEMAEASKVSARVYASRVPLLPEALTFSKMKQIPGGLRENQKYLIKNIHRKSQIDENLWNVLFDPQTSGGLLIALAPDRAEELITELKKSGYSDSAVVGEVTSRSDICIEID